ncbi:unnamed protein product [Peronospora farinosa]|uniref:VPS9 domain-containing protein n=1 Tax=Peronospora farinosa TaxID=134698 RepID=A0ABN8BZ92_9STRA|nr:unnamed protein product [Peronospora farinosa]
MFWGRNSGKLAVGSATSRPEASQGSSQYAETTAFSTIPVAPSYVFSEQRRSELLLAARANRVSWVDGVHERKLKTLPVGFMEFSHQQIVSTIPSHCREALEGVNHELSSFFTCLEELKHKILVNDLQLLKEEETEADDDTQSPVRRYHTLFQEIREQESLLNQWQQSHSPRTEKLTGHDREMAFLVGFRELVALLKNPEAAELVYRIQSFVKRMEMWDLPQMLSATTTQDRPGRRIQDFINKLVEQIKHSKKLRLLLQGGADDGETQQQHNYLHVFDASGVDLLHEVLEAFLMEKVYARTLTPSVQAAKQDDAFHERIKLLDFVTFQHLDLPVPKSHEQEQTWILLARQLEAMTLCPSPRRKMDGVLRVCQDLTMFLKTENGGRFPSADEFLPALIFVVLRANPCELKRNVAFILEYRNPTKLVSEPGYFFTHLVSSVAFLEEVDCSQLTISAEEFDEGLHRSKESLRLSGVCCETVHEVTSNEINNNTGEATNNTVIGLQKERQKQMPLFHVPHGCHKNDDEALMRLPTVLDVRANRLRLAING